MAHNLANGWGSLTRVFLCFLISLVFCKLECEGLLDGYSLWVIEGII
jgi:hypothetical protein